jgi:hypothetical protein
MGFVKVPLTVWTNIRFNMEHHVLEYLFRSGDFYSTVRADSHAKYGNVQTN